jgi:hypothetical protein
VLTGCSGFPGIAQDYSGSAKIVGSWKGPGKEFAIIQETQLKPA